MSFIKKTEYNRLRLRSRHLKYLESYFSADLEEMHRDEIVKFVALHDRDLYCEGYTNGYDAALNNLIDGFVAKGMIPLDKAQKIKKEIKEKR